MVLAVLEDVVGDRNPAARHKSQAKKSPINHQKGSR